MTQLPSALQSLARELDSDVDFVRIKKLLLLACTGHWESDDRKIELLDSLRLIQHLQSLEPTFERLDMRLRRAAAYLNKPLVYGSIADRLSSRLGLLYEVGEDESTVASDSLLPPPPPPVLAPSGDNEERTILSGMAPPPPPMLDPEPTQRDDRIRDLAHCNWFALRFDIARTTNPLRVKILSFFTLEAQNSFNAYTWASIKAELLDRLLFRLCETAPTLADLNAKLRNTVNRFPETEEYAQAAEATVRALDRWVYSAGPDDEASDGEAFSATGRLPEFDHTLVGVAPPGTGADDDLEEEEIERSVFAVENIFLRSPGRS